MLGERPADLGERVSWEYAAAKLTEARIGAALESGAELCRREPEPCLSGLWAHAEGVADLCPRLTVPGTGIIDRLGCENLERLCQADRQHRPAQRARRCDTRSTTSRCQRIEKIRGSSSDQRVDR